MDLRTRLGIVVERENLYTVTAIAPNTTIPQRVTETASGSVLSNVAAEDRPVPAQTGGAGPPSYAYTTSRYKQYRVKLAYTPREPDELELNSGELVTVTETFVDGWARGYLHASGRSGMVPMMSLQELKVSNLTDSQLKDVASIDMSPSIARTTTRTRDEFSDLHAWLNPSDFRLAMFTLKEKRLKATRVWLMDELMEWATKDDQYRVFWLSGVAGVGKSVIAGCFADELQNRNQLAAHFFCKHDELARNDPFQLITTLAFQLAAFDPGIRRALRDLHEAEPNFLVNTPSIGLQFEHLIVKPASAYRGGKAVILIDALDECAVEGSLREKFLQTLAQSVPKLPRNIVLFITSRPSPDLKMQLSEYVPRTMELGDIYNLNDIKLYAMYRMTKLRPILESDQFVDSFADKLSVMAHGLFVWLYLACDTMDKSDNLEGTLAEMENRTLGNDEERMDNIYTRALVASFKGAPESSIKQYTKIVGALVCLRTPMSVEDIAALLGSPSSRVRLNLSRIESLLVMSKSSVRLMHKSVADFITSPDRCIADASPFYIDRQSAEMYLAKKCLDALPLSLKVESIQVQIERLRGITPSSNPALSRYVLNHWCDHLNSVEQLDSELTTILTRTLQHYGRAMLIVAVLKNFPVALKYILKLGGGSYLLKATEKLNCFQTPILFEAATSDHADICETLLEYGGADVDAVNNELERVTALYICSFSHTKRAVVEVLLRHGANIDFRNPVGFTVDTFAAGSAGKAIDIERARRKVKLDESNMDDIMNAARWADLTLLKQLLADNPSIDINYKYPECNNKTLLSVACQYGSFDVVVYLLSIGADPNIANSQNLIPLHHACSFGSVPIVQALIDAGTNLDTEGQERKNVIFSNVFLRPIDWACENGHIEIVRLLLDKGVSPHALGDGKIHPLLYAAMGGSVEVAQLLVEKGVDINYQSRYFGTAIVAGAYLGSQDVVSYLIDIGADTELGWDAPGLEVEALRSPKVSPLMASAIKGHHNIFALLLARSPPGEKSVRLEMRTRDSWCFLYLTPMLLAAMGNEPELVRLMLEYGADVDGATVATSSVVLAGETTPLQNAAYYGRIRISRMLLEAGANIHARGPNRRSSLLMVASSGIIGDRTRADMTRLLRFYKADLDDVDHDGNTAVHLAIGMKATETVKALVELGARLDIVNNLGNSCLHAAARQRAAGMVNLLIDKGADKGIANKEGMSPLQIAVKEGYSELVQLLK
ncbi:hypothetical protein SmJEL517_g02378 [Synchytrium microbalum]|uniref:SH3 domain-containing protein n=1 Tax=Synchytrium microbalum TaxID=1806994 RepID=A0A507CAM9_9FUNG|nr:uncharacterized protein SmJEL517_g02378 [Synchytrium microbalum]TPX35066.1 hypothetical protein SmJEL517_g02378 [Synchytrium microbalum]